MSTAAASAEPHTAGEHGPRIAGIVLAGGAATRLGGEDKTRRTIAGATSLERVLRSIPPGLRVVVGPEKDDGARIAAEHGARFVREDPPRSGPLAALARGVQEVVALEDSDVRVLVLGGDMPLLRAETLERLVAADRAGERVVALTAPDGHLQFLCACWPLARLRRALAAVERPEGGWADLSLRRLYRELAEGELMTLPATGAEVADLDTPEDVAAVERAAGPRIALAQIRASEVVETNLRAVEAAAAEAAGAGAHLVLLPEATLTPFGTDLHRAASAHHERFENAVAEIAERHGIVVVAGSFVATDDGRVRNTVIVRGGGLHADYAKIHLYDAYGARESDTVEPGTELVTIDLAGARFGIATCYDVRFPAQFTALARAGAQAVLLPMAWGDGPGKSDQLEVLLRARALDATVAILAADQAPDPEYTGRAARGVGLSAVVGPLGQVRRQLGREPGMIVADLDLAEIAQARAALPVLEHGAEDHLGGATPR
ncbi:nitrilase-related carbon-nitrogen hydrolase [Brachybacterium sp. DNPG3]